jgi:putative endonuclease
VEFYVYILFSSTLDRYYVGYSSDLISRLDEHNLGATRSTRPGRPWKLVYMEKFSNKSAAIKRENQIKKMKSRKYIERLVSGESVG